MSNSNMKSFFDEIKDSTLTWTDDDEISAPSSYYSSDLNSSDDDSTVHDPGEDHADLEARADAEALLDAQEEEALQNQNAHQDNVGNRQDAHGVDPDIEQQPGQIQIQNVNIVNEGRIQNPQRQRQQQQPIRHAQPQQVRTDSAQILRNLERHQRSNELLFRIARSEQLPLIRAEIDWKLLQQQISTYPGAELGDEIAAFLLQSVLRMDPTLDVIREIIRLNPKSCVDMDPFYAACQYSSSEVVQLLMKMTMEARIAEGIHWSMLALLGDARIRLEHARLLLKSSPEAVVDPTHGVFGVSPLDRMLSGAFIHGDAESWVSKLKLALLTADRGTVEDIGGKHFYPFHALVKRIISNDFMGVQFGAFTFVKCLSACVDGEESRMPFHQVDENGNLPIHVVFGQKCNTNLGIIGERKLVKFLFHVNGASASIKNGDGVMPIRLAVANGWPVYDIIAHYCLRDYTEGVIQDSVTTASSGTTAVVEEKKDLFFHDVLSGPYSERFGISGARELVRFVLKKFPSVADAPDARGRYPIHLAIENSWPCHDLIVGAAPIALEVKDTVTGMYPFQIAACVKYTGTGDGNSWDSSKQLSTLFELIREGPLLLQGFRSEESIAAGMVRPRSSSMKEIRRKRRTTNKRPGGRGSSSSRRGSKTGDLDECQGENDIAPPTKKKCL
jgi:hypothetical protein